MEGIKNYFDYLGAHIDHEYIKKDLGEVIREIVKRAGWKRIEKPDSHRGRKGSKITIFEKPFDSNLMATAYIKLKPLFLKGLTGYSGIPSELRVQIIQDSFLRVMQSYNPKLDKDISSKVLARRIAYNLSKAIRHDIIRTCRKNGYLNSKVKSIVSIINEEERIKEMKLFLESPEGKGKGFLFNSKGKLYKNCKCIHINDCIALDAHIEDNSTLLDVIKNPDKSKEEDNEFILNISKEVPLNLMPLVYILMDTDRKFNVRKMREILNNSKISNDNIYINSNIDNIDKAKFIAIQALEGHTSEEAVIRIGLNLKEVREGLNIIGKAVTKLVAC